MLSVGEVQQRILDRVSALDPLELSITDAHGCVLAETITAPEDLPPSPTSAGDGFAIRAQDVSSAGSTPVSLTIIGEASASGPFAGRVTHGEAVRISAGASLPEGTDSVVRKSDVAVVGSSMAIGRAVSPSENVRPAGEDVAKGDPVMQEGQRVRGMDVGVLAALGRTRALVRPRPRVVIFAAGDPLPEAGEGKSQGPGRDANSFIVSGMTREAGAEPTRGGTVPADADALREKFQSYLPQADIFVTCGGISEDPASPVRQAAEKLGSVDYWTTNAQPDLSVAFGNVQGRPLLSLPEAPVAAILAFELFCRPALLKMGGRKTVNRPEVMGALEEGVEHSPGAETYLRVRAWRDDSGWRARLAGRQGLSVVSSVAGANGIAVVAADRPSVRPGDQVRLILLEPLEGW